MQGSLKRKPIIKGLFLWLIVLAGLVGCSSPDPLDLILRRGLVLDGSGSPAFEADIGIEGGEIVLIGDLHEREAVDEIDATGLMVAPGFIDVHTHTDRIARSPLAENYARMGVTTVVAGNCGGAGADVAQALAEIEETGISVNFATLVGHNTIRSTVMGRESRAPTAAELRDMQALVAKAMSEGALGLSTGLEYIPGAYTETAEIIELAEVAAAAGGLYASHLRNEGTRIEEAVAEAIEVGRATGCPVQISHLKIDSPSRWGISRNVLSMIDAARAEGIQVCADQYAYSAASSGLGIRFPAWALEGGREEINRRLDDAATWDHIRMEMKSLLSERGFADLSWAVVSSYGPDPSLEGSSIKEIALQKKGSDSLEAQLETAREMLRAGGAGMVYHFMSDEDIAAIMQHPQVAVASDSSVLTPGRGVPHPRGYGNNPRVLGHYVRELKVLPLAEAVRKMTSLPAGQFGLHRRGEIREGMAADLVVFDRETVADRATFREPHQYPAGIPHVIVNGTPVVRDGEHTGARPGQVERGPGVAP
jgi:N-acyl-D-amino-acid deacylase